MLNMLPRCLLPPRPLTLALIALAVITPAMITPVKAQTWTNGHYVVSNTIVVEPLSLSVVRGDRSRAIIVVAPSIEVQDSGKLEKIASTMPRLRDAWLGALGPYSKKIDLNASVAVDDLSEILQHTIDTLYGSGGTKVLITFASIRRL